MMSFTGPAHSVNSSIFVCNLPPGTSETLLEVHFGKIGLVKVCLSFLPLFAFSLDLYLINVEVIYDSFLQLTALNSDPRTSKMSKCCMQKDKTSGAPLIWLHRDKITQDLNGDATIAFEDLHTVAAAVKWYNNSEFIGNIISVSPVEGVQSPNCVATSVTIGYPTMQGVPEHGMNSTFSGETCGSHGGDYGVNLDGDGGPVDLEGSRRRGHVDGKPWQQEGDWPCPNSRYVTSLVSKIHLLHPPLINALIFLSLGLACIKHAAMLFRRGQLLIRIGNYGITVMVRVRRGM